jgi:hypothetical protein
VSIVPEEQVDAQLSEFENSLWVDWDRSPPAHLSHYTSLSGMRGIIEGKNFWASDIRFMNDTTEDSYAYKLVRHILANRRDIVSTELNYNLQRHGGIPGFGGAWFRYAVCFCGTADLLSQWRGYTANGDGVALAIKFAALVPYAGREFALIRVLYDPQRQTQMVTRFLDRALQLSQEFGPETHDEVNDFLGIVGYILIQLMLRFKHPQFAQEDEWRVLLIVWAEENCSLVHYRDRNDRQVPYIELPFRAEYLEDVLIGPGSYGMEEAIPRKILAACGMRNVPVKRSTIPLR